ncbi:MAG: ATP-binding protein, partial [Gammaproteobacteria bacterium]|nr:ATP-binding protein [Gammaproteobacteria bacterium]
MPYDSKKELDRVRKFYSQDPMQKRFSAIVTGETNAGKTFLLRTARMPVHIDSFDPGGTKCLNDLIRKGNVISDTKWETEDPFNPKIYAEWKRTTELRIQTGYFDMFGTYVIDSLTTFGQAAMNYQLNLKGDAGSAPQHRRDYNPQKVEIENQIRRLMNLSCDFIVTGHLRKAERLKSIDKSTGIRYEEIEYRLHVT